MTQVKDLHMNQLLRGSSLNSLTGPSWVMCSALEPGELGQPQLNWGPEYDEVLEVRRHIPEYFGAFLAKKIEDMLNRQKKQTTTETKQPPHHDVCSTF